MAHKNLILRTVYMDPDVDNALRDEAFATRTSKNELIRDYILLGMRSLALARQQNPQTTLADLAQSEQKSS